LESCRFANPSHLDYRTLLLSGTLPLAFLRGCGLPDALIDYLPSLSTAGPIQFYSCFISYSTANQEFVDRLYADLQTKGVRCWFAPHDMQGGKKIHEQIDEAIRVYDRLLLILSPESMSSEWVATEIAKARKKEAIQKRQVLFPISIVPYKEIESWELFDADRGKDSAREIREYFIPDFSSWKNHDLYTKAFDALLKSLKSEDAPPAAMY
jgi:TIR domain